MKTTILTLILTISLISCSNDTEIILPDNISTIQTGDKLVADIKSGNKVYLEFVKHYCALDNCPHNGEIINQDRFKSRWGTDLHTEAWFIERTHFMNPDWTIENCEDYIKEGVK